MTGNNTIAGFQLSAQQARVWSQQAGDAAPFRAESEVRIEGPLDEAKLKKAFESLVQRHEILRTVFQRQAGLKVPFQVIQESSAFLWQAGDQGFDLEQGPLLQVNLATPAPDRHTLRVSLPALCADLRSLQNLISELIGLYGDGSSGDDVMQYADVSAWQEELLAGDDTKAGREFWRDYCRKLDFASNDSILSAFAPSKCGGQFAPDVAVTTVDAAAVSSDFLLACWQVFLSRITGRASLTIGREFDGRKYAELENAVGLFSKYLPIDFAFQPDTSIGAVADAARSAVEQAYNWQEAFAWSQLDSTADLPLAFEYAELPAAKTAGGATFAIERQEACCERFQLKLAARRGPEKLALEFHFDSALLDRETVEYWAACFAAFLKAAAANPAMPAGRVPMMAESERQRLTVEWNQTAAEYPRERCLHELFEAQAALYPDRPAVRCEDTCLAYGELNERANRLAHALRRSGVGPESLVGLCVDRSTDMIAALLGILKAGGAFVPLSADHPKPRLAQQLAGAVALVTEEKFLARMPAFSGPVLCVDKYQAGWTGESGANPELRNTPESPAYVIYTSGSTGAPKGVVVRHRNLVNYATFITRRLELEKHPDGLHFATVSTLSADLGNTCIYPSLISGGCLHVIPHEVSSDAPRLRDSMMRWPVDVLKIVPSHLAALLDSGGGREVLPRKYLLTGGEALTPQLIEKISVLEGGCEILNHYGPTETTVGSLTLALRSYDSRRATAKTIPIGRPIANTQVYILDAHREPVPMGVAGELYIAGDGVTAGYINQPDLTAERFVTGPSGATMYRTGDLVRCLPDGNVEFLGRADDQVKIRGFRIELGEIESVLARHESVKQAVVLAREDDRGDKRLVAYVVPQRDAPIDIGSLREHVKGQLPDYMAPSAIVVIPKVPLNANGKIDRQALPMPEEAASASQEKAAPRTPTEEVIAAIWNDVLRREEIGIEEDFFEIGGHSLLATQIASRLRARFHIAAPVRLIFEAPTIAGLARRVDQARRQEQGLVPPPIMPVPRGQALPLSFAQERLWVLDSLDPNNPLYNIPRALRIKGALNLDALKKALNEILRRHESQRTTFGQVDGQPVQIVAPTLSIPFSLDDLTGLPESAREAEALRIVAADSLVPFNLATGPLVRARLVRLEESHHILLLTMHHIISDAWSAGILFQEMGALYEAFSQGRPSPLPELTLQYADYSAHERDWLSGEVLEKKLAFWRERLQGLPPLLDLPSDRPRAKFRSSSGSLASASIPLEILKAVKDLGRAEGATLFMTLMAGFQALLSRYSGQEQIVIGTDVANRATPETERMIGFFINLLPVATDLSGNPTFRELLGRVRDGLLEGYANQEVPFAKIVQELQPERSTSHNPIVQALFVMQNIPRPTRELAGLELEPFEVPLSTSKFDIAVFMVEKADQLLGYWVYSTDLFERETILRMARHFATLLEGAARQPDERLSALNILSEEEKLKQEDERKRRKQSQSKRLLSTAPAAIGTPAKEGDKR